MQEHKQKALYEQDDISQMALSLFEKVKQIKKSNPEVARNIDRLERQIRGCLEGIKQEIQKLDKKERDLVKILVINGLHRTADEVLID
jgi:hypothetical protein